MKYDVIVVGAGPAGSTVARECADCGLSVLLLDKESFPRDKACGGGITVRASDLLPFSIEPVVERTIYGASVSYKHGKGFTRYSDDILVRMTQRKNFDMLLLEKAVGAGVVFKQKHAVRAVSIGATSIDVTTSFGTFTGSVLVAADGANGKTAQMAGVKQRFWLQVALEGNITPPTGLSDHWESSFGLHIGEMPGGYGWGFPKSDHLNIGIVGWRYGGPNLRHNLEQLTRFYGYEYDRIWALRGHYLPIRKSDSPLASRNVILVGDAAGLIDPMTDEGIYAAIRSGQLASLSISEYIRGDIGNLLGYKHEIEAQLVPELNISRRFHDLFHLTPGFYLWAEKHTSLVWALTQRILRGDQTYVNVMLKHKVTATLIDFVSDLVRVTPFLQRKSGLQDPALPQRFFTSGHVWP